MLIVVGDDRYGHFVHLRVSGANLNTPWLDDGIYRNEVQSTFVFVRL